MTGDLTCKHSANHIHTRGLVGFRSVVVLFVVGATSGRAQADPRRFLTRRGRLSTTKKGAHDA
jgi:hypothetical protein